MEIMKNPQSAPSYKGGKTIHIQTRWDNGSKGEIWKKQGDRK